MIGHELRAFCETMLPRLLTQICRDPDLPEHGCCDRNWWHYKVRDFPSLILQQTGYTLHCAAASLTPPDRAAALDELARASAVFWNRRALKFRAFEEYYPWEEGYPPLAFSTLAVAKLVAAGVVPLPAVEPGLAVAARQLQQRFEPRATNQQVAGLAALCWVRKLAPALVDAARFDDLCTRTLACQHVEGWYQEYGGPDLGYLTVTMDCLWDAFDATGDPRYRASAARALTFLHAFTRLPSGGLGMHNARNTDYLVPYGIARFLAEPDQAATARALLQRHFADLGDREHFLHAVDDRYLGHYIGHSLIRAVTLIETAEAESLPAPPPAPGVDFAGSGHLLRENQPAGGATLVSTRKGGVVTAWLGGAVVHDYGWIARRGGAEWVSHWWGDFWQSTCRDEEIAVKGGLTPVKPNASTPAKHLALRVLSLLLGRRIIGFLKERMIFREGQRRPHAFSRHIGWDGGALVIRDRIQVPAGATLQRAPRASRRHVASADSYHVEDLHPVAPGIKVTESRTTHDATMEITTRYEVDR